MLVVADGVNWAQLTNLNPLIFLKLVVLYQLNVELLHSDLCDKVFYQQNVDINLSMRV